MKMETNLPEDKKPKYPVDVYLNGKQVGTMDRRGAVTFTDQEAVSQVMKLMDSNAVGLSSKDAKGSTYKDGAVHFTTLGQEEDVKMENHRIQLNKKKGRIL